MEFGVSNNDLTPVTAGSWLFLVGEAEPWICAGDQTTGCILWKQDVEATRIPQDKYEYPEFQVQPEAGSGRSASAEPRKPVSTARSPISPSGTAYCRKTRSTRCGRKAPPIST
jgi:hypothetical protein